MLKIKFNSFLWILFFLGSSFIFSSCDQKKGPQGTKEPDKLIVGMDLTFPPFEGLANDGKPYGISVELSQYLADRLGKKLVIENTPFEGLVPGLRFGKFDLVISSMSKTEEREKVIDFSVPYGEMGLVFVMKKEVNITDPKALNDESNAIVYRKGTYAEPTLKNSYGKAQLRSLDNFTVEILEVLEGKAIAGVMDILSAYEHMKQNPGKLKFILIPETVLPLAAGITKGNVSLKSDVDQYIQEFIDEGKMQQLADRYFADIKKIYLKTNKHFFLF